MLRLNYNIADEIGEFDSIVASKYQPARGNLIGLRPQVIVHYNEYLNTFNNIQNKPANTFDPEESEELQNCYGNSTAALESLKARLVSCQSETFQFLCPYCLILDHSTFDHYIPREEQPVYSACSKNLIPCCGTCNGKKQLYWKTAGHRAIIHFYNDTIPNVQFLFCDLDFNGHIPILSFRLKFGAAYDPVIRVRVENHFERLGLLIRYDEAVPKVLSEIDTDFKSLGGFHPTAVEVSDFLSRKASLLFNKCGINYWHALVYRKLSMSDEYIANLIA
jgi:5-methylcytosine-specific restriction endonuclease McrA